MTCYYNEFDPKAAAWLRELIKQGHIADGVVDERSIEDVRPSDLAGFTQCHFFAGIGGWSLALRQAGVPDSQPVWTGSCPCQPFSAAGKGAGMDDERHLWPAFFHLIEQRRPASIFGEQVASADGLVWLDLVHADLEGAGYAFGAADLCAAGVGAPHIRQRLYWAADANMQHQRPTGNAARLGDVVRASEVGRLADSAQRGRGEERAHVGRIAEGDRAQGLAAGSGAGCGGLPDWLADTDGRHASTERQQRGGEQRQQPQDDVAGWLAYDHSAGLERFAGLRLRGADLHDADGRSPVSGFWAGADWLPCRDNKWRPVEPGTFPLAHGLPARVGRLRGYGNAIVPQVAATFIQATGLLT